MGNAVEQGATARRDVAESSTPPAPEPRIEVFTFGDPEPVMDRREILDSLEAWRNGRWYEPPIPPAALTRAFRVGPHHSSAILVKRNILSSLFRPSRWMSRDTFEAWVLDFLVLGNGYLEDVPSMIGSSVELRRLVGRYIRRGVEPGQFFQVENFRVEQELPRSRVFQLMEADLNQEVYGVPEYVAGLQSAFLNEAATLFRRRYYLNGSHAGFIMYVSDPSHNEGDIEAMRQALKNSKGPGNFRNLFFYSPGGKKDGIQIIPISEVAARDEFLGIKNTTRDDILAAHRVPPQLLGVVPQNSGGFGDVARAADAFYRQEIIRLQRKLVGVNRWLGVEAVAFDDYTPMAVAAAAAATPAA